MNYPNLASAEVTKLRFNTGASSSPPPSGTAPNIQHTLDLSPLQDGILSEYLLRGKARLDASSILLELSGNEQLDRLTESLQSVIDRHDTLRTVVQWEKVQRPKQIVYREARLCVEYLALDPERDSFSEQELMTLLSEPEIDLQQAPAVRLRVADEGNARYHVLLQVHAWACDCISFDLLLGEVLAHLQHRQHDLPQGVRYGKHIASESASEPFNGGQTFFSDMLQSIEEPSAPFAVLNSHSAQTDFDEAEEVLDIDLTEALRNHASVLGVNTEAIVHAAYALVVAHTSGCDDVVYGRGFFWHPPIESNTNRLLGNFFNQLPLRLALKGLNVRELVEQSFRTLTQLAMHSQVSPAFARQLSSVPGASPLFTALLVYRAVGTDQHSEGLASEGIRTLLRRDAWPAHPVVMRVDHTEDAVTLRARTLRPIVAKRMLGYLRTSLASLIHAIERASTIAALKLPILPIEERHRVVEVLNAKHAPHSQGKLIHEFFEEQAARTPSSTAVVHQGQSLTYTELNDRANELARSLRLRGVGPDSFVGICVERSLEMIVGLLGILKAGGAYVPLDPNYPPDRLHYMLEDAAPRVVLTHARTSALLPASEAEVVRLDAPLTVTDEITLGNVSAAEVGLTSQNLLYVIYTSGSTGKPKGIAMYHRAMTNLVQWHQATFGPGRPRVLQFAALSFDVAFQEIFSTLCTGGTLVLPDEWIRKDVRALTKLLSAERVERLFVPPLMLQSLAEHYRSTGEIASCLRDIITAGEQLRVSPEVVEFMRQLRACRLHNHYGPTETHVVTALTLVGDPGNWPALPTIGSPIANSQIYILDRQLGPVPLGVIGEVYIAGANVARCYLKRPALSAQRFVPDPFSAVAGAYMYQTGDLGRWLEDGTVQYLGRNDDQVKIRGYRIELGEIEAQLARHTQVKEAAVVARGDTVGQKRLVAYVTQQEGDCIRVEDLREQLRGALPQHMVPCAFVILERLPLTPSGKLDRRSLPAPAPSAYGRSSYEAPQGDVEQTLAEIWQKLLQAERVGRHDDFFELGGDSLAAMTLMIQISERFKVSFAVDALLRDPTLHAVAQHVEALSIDPTRSSVLAGMDLDEGVI